jgi:hypothetical protein
MSKGCGCCVSLRMERKDFRQDHGGGPEELPHRKKGVGKKYCRKNKGPHVFDTHTEWRTYGSFRYRYAACKCGKHSWNRSVTQYLVTNTWTGEDGKEYSTSYWR